eukprot:7881484-Pyramimonas_sp.AAC.1
MSLQCDARARHSVTQLHACRERRSSPVGVLLLTRTILHCTVPYCTVLCGMQFMGEHLSAEVMCS